MVKVSFVLSVSTTAPIQFRQIILAYSVPVAEHDSCACE